MLMVVIQNSNLEIIRAVPVFMKINTLGLVGLLRTIVSAVAIRKLKYDSSTAICEK